MSGAQGASRKQVLVAFSVTVLAAASAYGQGQQQSPPSQQQPSQQGQQKQQQDPARMPVNELIGMTVTDRQGKKIGQIGDVVLDLQGGTVHAVVVEVGGMMGLGEKNYAFPASELQPAQGKDQLALDVDKQKLENAEGFAKGQWPEMDSEYWGRVNEGAATGATAARGAGQQPPPKGEGAKGKQLVRASELEGKQLQDKAGEDVGKIQQVLVDLKRGEVRDIQLGLEGGGKASVKPGQLSRGTGDQLVLDAEAQQLRQQADQQKQQSGGQEGKGPSSAGGR